MRPLAFRLAGLAIAFAPVFACSSSNDGTTSQESGPGGAATTGSAGTSATAGAGTGGGAAGKGGTTGAGGKSGGTGVGGSSGIGGAGGSIGVAGTSGSAGTGGGGAGKGGSTGIAGSSGKGGSGVSGSAGKGGEAGSGGTQGGGAGAGGSAGGATSSVRVVGYLPNYSGSYGDWAKKIDFAKMTHLNLAFATATSNNDWDMGAADADVKALVDAAHAHGTKVLVSLGGGGGDQSVIARYKNEANIPALIANLDKLVAKHALDGADVDIEDPGNLGASYSKLVDQMVQTLRPKGKLVTVATAQYLQDSMSDATLHQFDFVNVMIYSSYADSVGALDYYSNKKAVPKDKLTLGAGFFGTDSSGTEYGYAEIMQADGQAWDKDQATVGGKTVHYTGVASMKKLADYSKGFGGIMFWELSLDVPGSHSLYKVIQDDM